MKKSNATTALLKERDMAIQVIVFLLMLPVLFSGIIGLFALYLMAIAQCIGCIFWYSYFRNEPLLQLKAGRRIRVIFMVLIVAHGVCMALPPALVFLVALMVLAGPVLGTVYFLVTIKEYKFYTKEAAAEAALQQSQL